MSVKDYLKRGLRFVISGVPQKKVVANICTLAPNELLKGRTALITGGTSGIGFAIAESFLKSGANVIITGRSGNRIEEACKRLEERAMCPDKIHGMILDNTDVQAFPDKLREAEEVLGGRCIDVLVNNAGINGGHIKNTEEKEYDQILDTNLKGVFFLCREVAKLMIEGKIAGNILNVASSSSLRPANTAYALSKWGIRGLTLGLAKSLTPYNIVVNGIAPGPTETPMLVKEERGDITNSRNPSGRYAKPEEIASMATILVSGIGRMVVGDIVYMTGGAGVITLDDVEYKF